MSLEIERKFLVKGEQWKSLATSVLLKQGYLSSHPDRTVRVRIEGDTAMLTIKGRTKGMTRNEWEYAIPVQDAMALLDMLCEKPVIEKYRYRIPFGGLIWEVDEFLGENDGLIVAEVELNSEQQEVIKPDWVAEEVTHDSRYFNANLLQNPYSNWQTT